MTRTHFHFPILMIELYHVTQMVVCWQWWPQTSIVHEGAVYEVDTQTRIQSSLYNEATFDVRGPLSIPAGHLPPLISVLGRVTNWSRAVLVRLANPLCSHLSLHLHSLHPESPYVSTFSFLFSRGHHLFLHLHRHGVCFLPLLHAVSPGPFLQLLSFGHFFSACTRVYRFLHSL